MELYILEGPFQFIYDGNMTLAASIVRLVRESHNFTLKEYPDQEQFYNTYMNHWNKLQEYMIGDGERCAENITNDLYHLKDKRELSLYDFLVAYNMAIAYVKNENGTNLCQDYVINNYRIQDLSIIYKQDGEVPFISKNGLYGINTYLYLYFNDLIPIQVSDTPYPVHNDYFKGDPFMITSHDFGHSATSIEFKNDYPDIDLAISHLYRTMMNEQDKYEVKIYLLLMFVIIHESGTIDIDKSFDYFEELTIETPEYVDVKFINDLLDELEDDDNTWEIIFLKLMLSFLEVLINFANNEAKLQIEKEINKSI